MYFIHSIDNMLSQVLYELKCQNTLLIKFISLCLNWQVPLPYIDLLPTDSPANTSLWRHQMETYSTSLALCGGNSPGTCPVNFLHKGQWRGALMSFLICTWINGWLNNRDAGGLRSHRVHRDVTVIFNRPSENSDIFLVKCLSVIF